MDKLNFHFAVHCHQPVGNFEGVFRESYEKSYKPFIKAMMRHPAISFGLHISGPLWDWVEGHEPAFITDIERLAEREQVEMISGGFYEPILEVLTDRDAAGQINMMNKFIRTRFKQNPKGLWLAERVWDPSLPVLFSKLGIKYTTVDDTHFYYAGLDEKDIHGYYVTERSGNALDIFPIQKKLRYAIPFKEPAAVIDLLKYYRDALGVSSVTYADDGEKFGVWPGTYKWVFEQEWLERFLTELEKNLDWLNITTQGDYVKTGKPTGRIYLPSASYEEMLEWALPAESAGRFKNFEALLDTSGVREYYKPFVRGGFWDNFLVKYPESNWMHKRMLLVSNALDHEENRIGFELENAQRELFKSQTNCSYWHGVFGGIYLNYLRHAVYEHLLRAEEIIDERKPQSKNVSYKLQDIDLDGAPEAVLKNKHLSLYIAPAKGGALIELDLRDHYFNLTNLMTRRRESYHDLVKNKKGKDLNMDSPVTIHDMVNVHDEVLSRKLVYDWHPRYSFVEHFLPEGALEIEDFHSNMYLDLGDFTLEEHRLVKYEGNTVFLSRDGHLRYNNVVLPFRMEKNYRLLEKRLETGYRVTNLSAGRIDVAMLVELNLSLLGTDELRSLLIHTGKEDEARGMGDFIKAGAVGSIELLDRWQKLGVRISTPSLSALFVYPVETISSSESGFERIYQGTCFMLEYGLHLKPGESRGISIPMDFYDI